MQMRIILGAILALSTLGACVQPGERPIPGSALVGAPAPEGAMLLETFEYEPGAVGPWHGFAATPYYFRFGGKQPSVAEVAEDLRRDTPRVFKSQFARTQFVRAMAQYRPDVTSRESLAALLSDSSQVKIVPCEGKINTLSHNSQVSLKRFTRDCVVGELLVQLKVGGKWQSVFSLGCLNPIDGRIVQFVPDPCPNKWTVPTGPAPDSESVIVFVPPEAIACLPPTVRCDDECEDWMRGWRGKPHNPAIRTALARMINSGGGAYRLPKGTREIRLPAVTDLTIPAAWCNREIHDDQTALFMNR